MGINAIRSVKTLVRSPDTRVAEFEMDPGAAGEVHLHTAATECCICLCGRVQIKTGSGTVHALSAGDKVGIAAGESHQVINPGATPSRYLVVQYGGAYDFVVG